MLSKIMKISFKASTETKANKKKINKKENKMKKRKKAMPFLVEFL